ncbi:MAG: type II toxin-antitoxin system RelB/DinJ family antitoxin [Proteobacteria bacterium]|nr:type II toxin-antitoxin system RelB/DinJ family antitoxin [Pseudomonadota bacterium]
MAANAFVRARIDETLKDEATEILAAMGLTVSDFVRIGLTKVVHERGLPFEMWVPNATTRKAMKELDEGKGKRFDSAEALFKDLGI